MQVEPEILSVREVARRLNLHPVSLWRLEKAGKFISRVRVTARRTGYLKSEFVAWLANRERGMGERVCIRKAA